MSTELSQLYRAWRPMSSRATWPRRMPSAGVPTRQARNRTAVTAAAAAVLVAGTAVGVQVVVTGSDSTRPPVVGTTTPPATGRPSPTSGSTPTPAPTGTPSATAPTPGRSASPPVVPPVQTAPPVKDTPPAPTTIPDRAFFQQPANTKKGEPRFTGSDYMLPELCAASYPADRSLLARRTRHLIYKLPSSPADPTYVPDGSFDHTIASYPNWVAATWMDQLRAAVRDCPTQTINGHPYRQRLLTGTRYGDDSILTEASTPNRDVNGNPTGGNEIPLVSVVRLGNVVTVLYEQGWEGTSSDRAIVDDYTGRAVAAIRAWLK